MNVHLKRDDFAKHEGTKFMALFKPEVGTEIELVSVSEIQESDQLERFSLVFEGPPDADLVSGIVTMEHDEIGSIDLGISPFWRDDRCTKYEAVFNNLKTVDEHQGGGI